jgi:hypothetical protein
MHKFIINFLKAQQDLEIRDRLEMFLKARIRFFELKLSLILQEFNEVYFVMTKESCGWEKWKMVGLSCENLMNKICLISQLKNLTLEKGACGLQQERRPNNNKAETHSNLSWTI